MSLLLEFHEVNNNVVSPVRYVAKKDVHRIDACEDYAPVYKQGVRSFIRGRGKGGFVYYAHETAEELSKRMNS